MAVSRAAMEPCVLQQAYLLSMAVKTPLALMGTISLPSATTKPPVMGVDLSARGSTDQICSPVAGSSARSWPWASEMNSAGRLPAMP